MRKAANRLLAIAGAGLVSIGMAVASVPAAAGDQQGFSQRVFATGGSSLSHPDDITSMSGSIFVAWQNNADADGNPPGSASTVVRYSPSGRVLGSWNLTGRVDGMSADPAHERIIATTNEDSNTSLWTIHLGEDGGSNVTHYFYAPCTSACTLGHGGGTDAPHIYRGQLFISASNPSDSTQPAVYRASLSGTTATLTPVFFDNSMATLANKDSSQYGSSGALALSDPDSNTVVPGSSPRFARDFMLDSQGDAQQVYLRGAGSSPRLFVLNLKEFDTTTGALAPQAVDDSAWATASQGTLYVTDSANREVIALRGHFKVGTVFSAVTPGNLNTPRAGHNHLATLDLNTGTLTPVAAVTAQAKGLLFVPGEGNGDVDDDD